MEWYEGQWILHLYLRGGCTWRQVDIHQIWWMSTCISYHLYQGIKISRKDQKCIENSNVSGFVNNLNMYFN